MTRRKKTRCPGEKPVCSFCARLGQTCVYSGADVVDEGSQLKSMVRVLAEYGEKQAYDYRGGEVSVHDPTM